MFLKIIETMSHLKQTLGTAHSESGVTSSELNHHPGGSEVVRVSLLGDAFRDEASGVPLPPQRHLTSQGPALLQIMYFRHSVSASWSPNQVWLFLPTWIQALTSSPHLRAWNVSKST